jgi:hypothetical protein
LGEVLVDVNVRVKAKFIPLDQSMSAALLTYEQIMGGSADDKHLSAGCEIFVHNRKELYMFDISWHELS